MIEPLHLVGHVACPCGYRHMCVRNLTTADDQSIVTTGTKRHTFIRKAIRGSGLIRIICLGGLLRAFLHLALLLLTAYESAFAGQTLGLSPTVPSVSGALPSPQERILSPIPKQFDWMGRDVRSNPHLEALLGLQEGPPQLFMTLSLAEEFSDNFFLSATNPQPGFRTVVDIGTVYRLERGTSFISLANSISANYETPSGDTNVGFANLSLNAGYQLPRLSLALSESFIRSDSIAEATPTGVRQGRSPFLNNVISPQVRYDLTRTTAVNFGYTNTLIRNEISNQSLGQGDTTANSFAVGLQHSFTRALDSNMSYAFTAAENTVTPSNRIHAPSADLTYAFEPRTSASLKAFGAITDQSDGGTNSQFYGASIGIRRQFTSYLGGFFSIGPAVFDSENGSRRLFANWQANLDGSLPFTRQTSLTLSSQQSLTNTATDVQNLGVTLSQSAALRLNHTISRDLLALLFVNYTRTELLQNTGTSVGGQSVAGQGQKTNYWSAGGSVWYALTQILSLSADYRYLRQSSNAPVGSSLTTGNFNENRIIVSLSASFWLF